jgi:uncharacterized protein YaeQ
MALKSTIFKAELSISDIDRGYYASHALTLARHPSETDQRMMVRLLAFMLYADEQLAFGRGLSSVDEADLAITDYTGAIKLWIEVGLPDTRAIKRALSQADAVVVLAYGGKPAEIWWGKDGAALRALPRLQVWSIDNEHADGLTALAERTMQLQCTIQDGDLWISDGNESLHVRPTQLFP